MSHSLNTLNSDRAAANSTGIGRFAHELALLAGLFVLVFSLMSLLSYSQGDAAWSTTGNGQPLLNWCGRVGALISDGGYFLFGFSVWWLYLAGVRVWLSSFLCWLRAEPDSVPADGRFAAGRWSWLWSPPMRHLGFWVMLLALVASSVVLEWGRLYRLESFLPDHSGGAFGQWLGPLAQRWLGFTGAALTGIAVLVLTSAGVFGFSWGRWAEWLGRQMDDAWLRIGHILDTFRDARIGKAAVRTRDKVEPHDHVRETEAPPLQPQPDAAADKATGAASRVDVDVDIPLDEVVESDFSPSVVQERSQPVPSRLPTPVWTGELPLAPTVAAANPSVSGGPVAVSTARHPSEAAHAETHLPQVDLLDGPLLRQDTVAPETLEMTSRLIEKKLKDFGVEVSVVAAMPGPVITRYEIEPATGVKGSQVVNLAKDLARSLSLVSIRVIETIPGKNIMALELPNAKRQTIRLSEILGSPVYTDAKSLLTMGLGKDIGGLPVVADLAKMPHCLVAGTTGSGKSVGINAMILSLLYKADAHDVRLMLIDPKMLELSVYEGIPHLLCPVVTDMKHAANGLNWCVAEMEKRYKLLSKMGVRNLAGFNAKIDDAKARGEIIGNPFSLTPEQPEPLDRLPHIVVVIDELADLMMVVGKKIEELIARLAQKARAAGIHLILATQRPSVDVITGLIKANIPTRISFQVSSKIDSRTILDQMGAEALLGMGDMLYMPSGTGYPVRVHGAFVSDDEVHRVVAYLKEQGGEPNYIEGVLDSGISDAEGNGSDGDSAGTGGEKDPMYDQAVEVVLKDRKSSISYVQRKLKIGYNRAARIMEDMQNAGLVGPLTTSGQRDILVPSRTD